MEESLTRYLGELDAIDARAAAAFETRNMAEIDELYRQRRDVCSRIVGWARTWHAVSGRSFSHV